MFDDFGNKEERDELNKIIFASLKNEFGIWLDFRLTNMVTICCLGGDLNENFNLNSGN